VQNPQEVVDNWIDTLPVVNDEEAAPYAYSFLAQLIDQQVISLPSNCNDANVSRRHNPSVVPKAAQIFQHIVQALEAETIQGQTAAKVVASAKQLVSQTGLNAEQILQSLSPEGQHAVRSYFQ
jgi:hypothetical protein